MPFSSSSSSYFFHWATAKCGHFIGKKLHSLPSCVFLHVCDLFSYVNVNMYFSVVLVQQFISSLNLVLVLGRKFVIVTV